MRIQRVERYMMMVLLAIIAVNTSYDDLISDTSKFIAMFYCLLIIWEFFKDVYEIFFKKKK